MNELLIWDRSHLDRCRRRAASPALSAAAAYLREQADAALHQPPLSVTHEPNLPPSGNPHDYRSIGTYWWPNPDTSDGLPWVRRDGDANPDAVTANCADLKRLTQVVRHLALGWYILGDSRYADHAASLLRTWFVDVHTRMNPHLEYGQAIPGKCLGRGIGIIDTMALLHLLDPITLVAESGSLDPAAHRDIINWMGAYRAWCETSSHGIDECNTRNNHGTWYDAQVAGYALFTRHGQSAQEALLRLRDQRIPQQIEADGSQPHELARTRSVDYSVMNLRGMLCGARLGRLAGVEMVSRESDAGRLLRAATEFFRPYLGGLENWQWQQITPPGKNHLADLLACAGHTLGEPLYLQWSQQAFDNDPAGLHHLLHPTPTAQSAAG